MDWWYVWILWRHSSYTKKERKKKKTEKSVNTCIFFALNIVRRRFKAIPFSLFLSPSYFYLFSVEFAQISSGMLYIYRSIDRIRPRQQNHWIKIFVQLVWKIFHLAYAFRSGYFIWARWQKWERIVYSQCNWLHQFLSLRNSEHCTSIICYMKRVVQ